MLMVFIFFNLSFFSSFYRVPIFLNPVRETYNQVGMALLQNLIWSWTNFTIDVYFLFTVQSILHAFIFSLLV